jgi:hypothetical protein
VKKKNKPKKNKNIWANLYKKLQKEVDIAPTLASSPPIAISDKNIELLINSLFDVGLKKRAIFAKLSTKK